MKREKKEKRGADKGKQEEIGKRRVHGDLEGRSPEPRRGAGKVVLFSGQVHSQWSQGRRRRKKRLKMKEE